MAALSIGLLAMGLAPYGPPASAIEAMVPPPRGGHAMAYDAARGEVVMFGGNGLSDTWVWDGSTWTLKTPLPAPAGRSGHAMAYDAARGQVVLFGGFNQVSGQLNDTWVWNGTTWAQRSPSTRPPARSGHAMAYDAARGQVVLFGGADSCCSASTTYFSDTWVWNGSNWALKTGTDMAPSNGRTSHAMAYDAARAQVVLFGGYREDCTEGFGCWDRQFDDTRVWDGAKWTLKTFATPLRRRGHAMAYDAARNRVVLFGGLAGLIPTPSSETWVWNGSSWTERTPSNRPSSRSGHAMAYDAARARVVLFGGGTTGGSETWTWNGSNWSGRTLDFVPEPDLDASAGCDPLVPGPGATVTCWVRVVIEGITVIDEEHQETVPAAPELAFDAGCDPPTPVPGDTVTCWAWVEIDGTRVIDEEHQETVPVPPMDPGDLLEDPLRYASDECAGGTVVVDGYFGDLYLKLRTNPSPHPGSGDEWVCVSADDGLTSLGGRLELAGSAQVPPVIRQDEPNDLVSASCNEDPNNQRIQSGVILEEGYWIDVTPLPEDESAVVWVCVRLTDTLGFRLEVETSGGALDFKRDSLLPRTPRPAETPWPVSGEPSAVCKDPSSGVSTRLMRANVAGSQIALYAWEESATRAHLCLRGPDVGGRVTIDADANPGVGPLLTTSTSDLTPCAFRVFTKESPPSVALYTHEDPREPEFAGPPASACVTVASFGSRATLGADESATVEWHEDAI